MLHFFGLNNGNFYFKILLLFLLEDLEFKKKFAKKVRFQNLTFIFIKY